VGRGASFFNPLFLVKGHMAMPGEEILVLESISKSFGAVQALKGVSLSIMRGEIHTILGENGAGKSTLVKIIKGEIRPDSGRLFFEGNEIRVSDPLYANSIGITMVHQELTIFEDLSVAENIFANSAFRTRVGLIDKKEMRRQSAEKLALFNLHINPSEKISNLPLAEQRIVEILRAIAQKRKLIILDEPTAGLNETEARILISLVGKLRDEGITILYISHRISEVLELSDRISILRDGCFVSTVRADSIAPAELIHLMVGREVDLLYAKKKSAVREGTEILLELERVSKRNFIRDVSFTLRRNEILGVYGLQGSGVEKLSQILYGLDSGDSGTLKIKGEAIRKFNTDEMLKRGFIYLNDNRKRAGLFLDMSSADNMACPALRKLSSNGILKTREIQRYADEYIRKFEIVIPGARTRPKNLSGGNQQKLMFSVCLGTEPECVILNEPTRGIDVGAKAEMHKFILALPQSGTSVILFSSELPELMSLCDRVVVMKNNAVVGELSGDDINDEKIMSMAAGG
jgi:ABC-type sugar transport system ATPase subunit